MPIVVRDRESLLHGEAAQVNRVKEGVIVRMNANHKLLDTLQNLGKRGEPVERLYARMLDEELFIAAYTKLYSNKGAMTTGVDPIATVKLLEPLSRTTPHSAAIPESQIGQPTLLAL